MKRPEPVIVTDLFLEERAYLLDLLRELGDRDWQAPTACVGWSVKDVAAHLLGVDLSKISRTRDGFAALAPHSGEAIGVFINRINQEWVDATRRLSPRVLCDMLEMSGSQIADLFSSLDLFQTGSPVGWAGPEPAPVWLDVAREYTERWHHQQHIREGVGAPGLTVPRFMAPVIATFVWSLPHTFRDVEAKPDTMLSIEIQGESGGQWAVVRQQERWQLYVADTEPSAARVTMDQDTAWRLFTNGLSTERAQREIHVEGDPELGGQVRRAVAIII